METFLQQIVNGLVQGSIYALIALGYTMVYGIMGLINFAHGEVVMVGAFVAYTTTSVLVSQGVPLYLAVFVALFVAVLACGLLGYFLERVAYRPLRNAPRLSPLITAIGMSIVLQNLVMMIWGRDHFSYPTMIPEWYFALGGVHVSAVQLVIVFVSLSMMCALLILIYRTQLGLAMRATAQNQEVSLLMGINVNQAVMAAFVIGSALAAIAGIMVGSYYGSAHYQMGFMLGLKAFTAAVLGGIGSVAGAMLGGILLGLIEALGAGYIGDFTNVCLWSKAFSTLEARCVKDPALSLMGSNYQDIFAFMTLIAVLMFRPSGLLGEKTGDRA